MINYERIALFRESSVPKYYTFKTEDNTATFTNDNIVSESLTLKETLCAEEKLVFGTCQASELSFLTNDTEGINLVGKVLNCEMIIGNAVMNAPKVNLGRFIVTEDKLSSNKLSRQIKAVDGLYEILNADVTEWFKTLALPMTLKAFRNSFFEHIGYSQEDVELVNDSLIVERTIDSPQITGALIIKAICEINGVFGKMVRSADKRFKYVSLGVEYTENALYPAEDLYPSETLYPSGFASSEYHKFDTDNYFTVDYANYVSNEDGLDKLIIRQEENDVGITVGSGSTFDNVYVVQNNFLVYGMNTEQLTAVANNLYNKIKYVAYRPATAVVRGNPCLEVGDAITVVADNKRINTYILQRTLVGMGALKDTYTAKGVEKYAEEVNGLNAQINQLRGSTVKVKTDLEGLSVTVEDLADDVSAELELKVSKDDNDQVVSMINASADVITLNSNRLVVDSDNFKLTEEGTVSAKGNISSNSSAEGWYTDISYNGVNFHRNNNVVGWIGQAGNSDNVATNIYARNRFYTRIGETYADSFLAYDLTLDNIYGAIQNVFGRLKIHSAKNISTARMVEAWVGSWFDEHPALAIGTSNSTNSLVVWGNELVKKWLRIGDDGNIHFYNLETPSNPTLRLISDYGNPFRLEVYNGDIHCQNLLVQGSKNRVVSTEHYGARCLNAFETPYAQFGDNGSAEIGADGTCKIDFEKIFAETIDLTKGYQVSITQTSEKATKWVEKKDTCFIVHGDPKATFDWFVVARQRDYADVRLAEIEIPNVESEVTE